MGTGGNKDTSCCRLNSRKVSHAGLMRVTARLEPAEECRSLSWTADKSSYRANHFVHSSGGRRDDHIVNDAFSGKA